MNENWISTKDQLPEIHSNVIILNSNRCMFMAVLDDNNDFICETFDGLMVEPAEYVTHWMKLPELPKDIKNERTF